VETAEQVTRLTAMGCDLVQGFYFGKPAAAERTEALILSAAHKILSLFPGMQDGERAGIAGAAGSAAPAWGD